MLSLNRAKNKKKKEKRKKREISKELTGN